MRVLIAEDEALIRMDLREMLEEEGHEVVGEARDGAEAVELASRARSRRRVHGHQHAGCERHRGGYSRYRRRAHRACRHGHRVLAGGVRRAGERRGGDGVRRQAVHALGHRAGDDSSLWRGIAESTALAAEVADLSERLETRKVVDRAKGILMARGMTEPEAFRRLQKLAMDKRKTLREVADAILLASEAEE